MYIKDMNETTTTAANLPPVLVDPYRALRELDCRDRKGIARDFRRAASAQIRSGRPGFARREDVAGRTIVVTVEDVGRRSRSSREPNVPPTIVIDVWNGGDVVEEIRVHSLRGVSGTVENVLATG